MARKKSARRKAAEQMYSDARKQLNEEYAERMYQDFKYWLKESIGYDLDAAKQDAMSCEGATMAGAHVAQGSTAASAMGNGYVMLPSCFGERVFVHENLLKAEFTKALAPAEKDLYTVLLRAGALDAASIELDEIANFLSRIWNCKHDFDPRTLGYLVEIFCNAMNEGNSFKMPRGLAGGADGGKDPCVFAYIDHDLNGAINFILSKEARDLMLGSMDK